MLRSVYYYFRIIYLGLREEVLGRHVLLTAVEQVALDTDDG